MTDVKLGNRVFTLAVVAMTILWTVAAGLAPLATSAQVSLNTGDLIKGESFSTVYYYGSDGMRYTFPNEKTYFTWYSNFDSVTTVSDSQLAGITLGGNVVYRAGTNWVKIQSDDSVYAVSSDGTLHWIETEAVAEALYGGSGWASFVHDVPDTFFADYTTGTSLMSADALYDGALVSDGTNTYVIQNGAKRLLTGSAMAANRYQSSDVLNTTVDLSAIADGADVAGESAELSDTAQLLQGDDVSTPAGGLTIALASDTPTGVTLPGGANGVYMAKWRLSASGGDSTLDSLEVSLGGIGAVANIANLYLYEGTTRLTEARSVNSATRAATFSNLQFTVADGSSRYVSAVAEISATQVSGDSANFGLANVDAVGASGDISGSFPATGNTFSFGGSDVGTLTIAKSGTIVNAAIGQQDAQIGQFQIDAATEDASIERLRLKIDNASDHSDFRLWQGSTELASGVNTSGDFVDFALATPYVITDGANKIFKVTADVGGQINDDVKVYVDKDTDVIAVGGDFGFNMGVTRTAYDGDSCTTTAGDCSFSTLEGGDVTIVHNGPAADDIAVDSQDNVFLAFSLTATEDVTVKDFDLIISANDDGTGGVEFEAETGETTNDTDGLIRGNNLEANVKDISIRYADTGARLMGPVEISVTGGDGDNDGFQLLTLSDDFFLAAGTTLDLQVTVDIDNNTPASEQFAAAINIGSVAIEDSNGDAISASNIVPSGDVNGNEFTTQVPSLTFALASAPTSFTTVQGSANQKVIGYTATAGTASDVTITSVTMSAYGDYAAVGSVNYTLGGETNAGGSLENAQVEDHFSSCSLYDGAGTLVAGPKGASSSGSLFVFDNMSWTIAGGLVEKMDVVCNLANPSETADVYFAFNLGTDADGAGSNGIEDHVVSQDESGDSITETGGEANGTLDSTDGTPAAPTVAVTVAASGSIAVAADSATPDASILMTGSSDNLVSKFRVTATNEDMLVTRLSFTEEQATDDTIGTSSSIYSNNISAVKLTYPDSAGATQTATAYMSGKEVKFDGLSMFVPSNSPKIVDVYVNVPTSDRNSGGSATSGEKIQMDIWNDTTNLDNFRAVGQGSGTVLDDSDAGTPTNAVNTHVVRETVPTVSLHASSPSGSKLPGLSEVLRFTISAASNEDVVVDEFVFKMTATDNTGTPTGWNEADTTVVADFTLYNYSDLGTALEDLDSDWKLMDATGLDSTAAVDIGFVRLENMSDDIVIAAGTTETFSLYFDSTGASSANDDQLRFDIPADPIVSTFLVPGTDNQLNEADLAPTDSILTVAASSVFSLGDILCMDTADDGCGSADERMLVAEITDATTIVVVRGYMDTAPDLASANDANDDIDRITSSLVWRDNGSTASPDNGTEQEVFWGSYLVDNLPITGGSIIF